MPEIAVNQENSHRGLPCCVSLSTPLDSPLWLWFRNLVCLFLTIRREHVCSVKRSDPESKFPVVKPYHSLPQPVGQQPQSLTLVIRWLFVDEWISQIAQFQKRSRAQALPCLLLMHQPGMSITGCWCCVHQSPGRCHAQVVMVSFGHCFLPGNPCWVPTGIAWECPETSKDVVCHQLMESSLPCKRWRSGGGRMKSEATLWLLKVWMSQSSRQSHIPEAALPDKVGVSGGAALAKLCKALLSWGWSLGQFLVGSAGQNTWVKSPQSFLILSP